MLRPVQKIAPLLFCSGACALLYQTVWLREFRLVFGASTAASAAVLAMFMGGLGAGGLVLGKRIDGKRDPLMWYANLELGVAGLTAITPFLVDGARFLYSALGGTVTMGMGLGTVVRLLLSAVVLLPVTFLMGGTLPAAAKAAENDDDPGRRNLALLYGVNTLGAVVGVLATTFFLLEVFGGRLLLWMCCLLNALLGVIARGIARGIDDEPARPAKKASAEEPAPAAGDAVPAIFVLAAAAIVGFAFLLMELVFYRMLGPILGGSTYTFGLILVFALLGVGLGGAAYPLWAKTRPATVRAFALTCLLEAFCFLVPYALGDRIGLLALFLRPLKGLGFYGLASGWAVVAAVVVLPAAFVSGFQFPLLMALLGRGRKDVGRDVGLAYAWNTGGSILGSLAGGFGLIPWLTAPGVWRLSALLLVALGLAAVGISFRTEKRRLGLVVPGATAVACLLLAGALGPTAGFRHSPIGAGRADDVIMSATTNRLRDWLHNRRRSIAWEADGIETSVALSTQQGYNFIVGGKVDGHVRIDAGTQVMSGLIGATLHPDPKRAMVVGLGTGSTAGWLGAIPSMERVDVVELEPAILRVARDCAPVNHGVLDNPKVHVSIADAREVLITTKQRYDLIVSEPSNPYRAGIASMFTADFYEASVERLAERGIFLQWLQAYDTDGQTVRTVYATLASVFPHVETWLSDTGDLILVASREALSLDAAALRARLAEEPYRSAMANAWRMIDLEGFLAHHVANDVLTRAVLAQERASINTDDRNLLEVAYARTIGRERSFDETHVFEIAIDRAEDRPDVRGKVDWEAVDDRRMAMFVVNGRRPLMLKRYTPAHLRWFEAWSRHQSGDFEGWRALWAAEGIQPRSVLDLEIYAEGTAKRGAEEAPAAIEALRPYQPVEADALLARYHFRKNKLEDAANAAVAAIEGYRTDPWPELEIMQRFLGLVVEIGSKDKAQGARLFEALKDPFVTRMLEEERLRARVRLAGRVDFHKLCVDAYTAFEPHVPFRHAFLRKRLECYAATNHPRKADAERDLTTFLDEETITFRAGLEDELRPLDDPAGDTEPPGAGDKPARERDEPAP